MTSKRLIMFGMVVGSTVGSYVPSLWGAGWLSLWSVVLSGVGGVLGIWAGYQLGKRL